MATLYILNEGSNPMTRPSIGVSLMEGTASLIASDERAWCASVGSLMHLSPTASSSSTNPAVPITYTVLAFGYWERTYRAAKAEVGQQSSKLTNSPSPNFCTFSYICLLDLAPPLVISTIRLFNLVFRVAMVSLTPGSNELPHHRTPSQSDSIVVYFERSIGINGKIRTQKLGLATIKSLEKAA